MRDNGVTEKVNKIAEPTPIAYLMLDRLNYLAARIYELEVKVEQKLAPIMRYTCYSDDDSDKACVQEYPTYFSDMRSTLTKCERAIGGIEEYIERVEF